MNTLPIAVLHAALEDGDLERNRFEIARLAVQAADEGARLIVAPELFASGYLSLWLNDVARFGEEINGRSVALLKKVARDKAVYLCAGFCEYDPVSGKHHNAAVVVSPSGEIAARHRKVVCETRWAAPGGVNALSRFDTPWGRVGVLICADTYSALLPRTHALRGVDLLLVPSTWPDCGLDPREVWRARALENGVGLAACNRTGRGVLDCMEARSFALSSNGNVLLDLASENSAIGHFRYPLENGRFSSRFRETALAARTPSNYTALSCPSADLSSCESVRLLVECYASAAPLSAKSSDLPRVVIGPRIDPIAGDSAVVTQTESGAFAIFTPSGHRELSADHDVAIVDFGPVRIALIDSRALMQPEAAVSLIKQGCDLIVAASRAPLTPDARLLLGIKSIERAVVAAWDGDEGIICAPPLGVERWLEVSTADTGACSLEIDTAIVRKRSFIENLDLEALLNS